MNTNKEDLIEVMKGMKKALCKICDEVKKQVEGDVLLSIEDVQLSLALKMKKLGE